MNLLLITATSLLCFFSAQVVLAEPTKMQNSTPPGVYENLDDLRFTVFTDLQSRGQIATPLKPQLNIDLAEVLQALDDLSSSFNLSKNLIATQLQNSTTPPIEFVLGIGQQLHSMAQKLKNINLHTRTFLRAAILPWNIQNHRRDFTDLNHPEFQKEVAKNFYSLKYHLSHTSKQLPFYVLGALINMDLSENGDSTLRVSLAVAIDPILLDVNFRTADYVAKNIVIPEPQANMFDQWMSNKGWKSHANIDYITSAVFEYKINLDNRDQGELDILFGAMGSIQQSQSEGFKFSFLKELNDQAMRPFTNECAKGLGLPYIEGTFLTSMMNIPTSVSIKNLKIDIKNHKILDATVYAHPLGYNNCFGKDSWAPSSIANYASNKFIKAANQLMTEKSKELAESFYKVLSMTPEEYERYVNGREAQSLP